MLSDALREEDGRHEGCTGMAPCILANVHGLPGAFGLEQRRATIAPLSSLELALGVWTLKFGSQALTPYLLREYDEVPCLACRAEPSQSCARAKTW